MIQRLLGGRKKAAEAQKPRTRKSRVAAAFGPPITQEERQANKTELQHRLHLEMKCHAGKNQVFIRSLLTGGGTTEPRITLKCHLRRDIGLPAEVFYEHIRDVCCADPQQCPAYRAFRARHVPT